MCGNRVDHHLADRDGTPRGLRLQRSDLVRLQSLPLDADRTAQEVDVGESKSEQLADPKARAGEHDRYHLPPLPQPGADLLDVLERRDFDLVVVVLGQRDPPTWTALSRLDSIGMFILL